MTPREFVDKWRAVDQKERSTAQSHFNDLCDLLGEPKPLDDDPTGERYAFERGASKTGGGEGWADVWRKGCFAWEYKGKHKDLEKALAQVKQYASALNNPPLLVACDIERIVVTTNWTNTVSVRREIRLDDLLASVARDYLKRVFRGDESLRTGESRAALTQKVAREFANLARQLQDAGHDPLTVAHFVNRMVFCMFAEDAGLLADDLFSKMLEAARAKPADFVPLASDLFRAMSKGGRIGYQTVEFFNGGLFEDDTALPLDRKGIDLVRAAAALDWSAIDPSILGTLFERGLDPAKRSQLGAHYTDFDNIMRIVGPVVLDPLAREWEEAKAGIEGYKAPAKKREVLERYLARLRGVTVLDPACGSGNFLYVALRGLKDLEHRVLLEAEALGLGRRLPELGPEVLRGIELNPYAAELARVSIWVGELQWQIEHGYGVARNPILKPLATIENKDALLDFLAEGTGFALDENDDEISVPSPIRPPKAVHPIERTKRGDVRSGGVTYVPQRWPRAEFIVGNPPFLGGKLLRRELGDRYVDLLFAVYAGTVPREADLCAYWFEKARAQIEAGKTKRAGLIATQGIRGGANRRVLQRIKETGDIFLAWSDINWTLDGAAVHVSIVGFDVGDNEIRTLNGSIVSDIHANLTSEAATYSAHRIPFNAGIAFQGPVKVGPFELEPEEAEALLRQPNPTGRPNSDVLTLWANGSDIAGSGRGMWIINFRDRSEAEAAGYEGPFGAVESRVKPNRIENRDRQRRERWWLLGRSGGDWLDASSNVARSVVTPRVAKHRLFAWVSTPLLPDSAVVAFAVEDDYTFGVLHSRFHELWARAQGTQLREVESGFRYTPTTCFETFPFPEPTAPQRLAVADAARELNALRENWLNPPGWTQDEPLVFPATVGGPWHRWIPDADALPPGTVAEARYVRRVARPGAAKMVAARTLTKLYNDRPAWLRNAHAKLDIAVATAYRLPPDIPDAALLAELLRLNLERANVHP